MQLGERLIERGRGGFALTQPGELLLTHADALAERLRLGEAQLGETPIGKPPWQAIYAVLPPAGAHRLVTPLLATLTTARRVFVAATAGPIE